MQRNSAISTTLLEKGGGAVLFNPDNSSEFVINGVGLYIWQSLDGQTPVAQIIKGISKEFDGVPPNGVESETNDFLTKVCQGEFAQGASAPFKCPLPIEEFPVRNDGPSSLELSLTGKCNLSCKYCFFADEMKTRPDLPKEDWFRFFDELKGLSVRHVSLSGGEVFSRPDLFEIIDRIIASRLRFDLLSNGSLITRGMAQSLAEPRLKSRILTIQISIDGSKPEIHDQSRGAGSFAGAVQGMRLLQEAGLPVSCRVTINRCNVHDLDDISHFLLEEIGLPSFSTNDAIPLGEGCHNQNSISLTPAQKLEAMETLARLSKKYPSRITATAGPLANHHFFTRLEQLRKGKVQKEPGEGFLSSCGCIFGKLSVNHDGSISPCSILCKLIIGQINQDRLRDIWKSHSVLKTLRERRQIPLSEIADCIQCKWNAFCRGGCPGVTYHQTHDLKRANPHDCYRLFMKETGHGIPKN